MPNRTLSTSIDETLARSVEDLVKIEGVSSSQFLAAALNLYLRLPHEAHRAFRVVEAKGNDEERARTVREVTRALLSGEYEVARRDIASRLGTTAVLEDEDDLTDEAIRLVNAARR
jgi:metal-responsive CopG/Arc/MetJ family transcriptional regulator